MASSPLEALNANKPALLRVLAAYGVTNPRVFGSVSRGDFDSRSDIDLLVSKTRPMSYATIARLRRDVRDAVGWPVDLVFETALKPGLRETIQSELQPLA